ncbi:uncharacterized protein LOC123317119 [Coccinella septempunctata]|uniref:uncharacterized protein LOC123317119 n=1 Tax=Coccinella septempunctata TaxID=41139 RepID=UPI001D05FF18|nr:uncharacterized protein LOC123317119 [Coccinella septempunctata]
MSASTIVIKNPPPSATGSVRKSTLNNATYSIVVPTLWLVSAVFAAARADTSPNGTGVLVSLTIQDVIMLTISCWLLHKSLCTRNFLLAVPWVGMMAYSIYFTHYKGLLKMISTFRYARVNSTLPWMTVGLSIVALVIRTFLTMRVLQLSTYLWYRKRLEKELYYQLME